MTFDAVLWDMDGTLVDSEHFAVAALRDALLSEGLPVPDDLYETVVGQAADALYARFVADLGLRLSPVDWEERKLQGYLACLPQLQGFAPALAAFRHYAAAGRAQAVVSNSDRMIMDANLSAVGLARPGLITISRNDLRRGKPDPEGYLRALWLLDCPPARALVVEDSIAGAKAGLAAGLRTIFVPHATVAPPPGVEQLPDMAALDRLVLG